MIDKPLRVESMWAFLAIDPEDGNEGIMAFQSRGTMMPMVAADEDRVASLRPVAAALADAAGVTIRLARFTTRTDLETIGGQE